MPGSRALNGGKRSNNLDKTNQLKMFIQQQICLSTSEIDLCRRENSN